MPNYDENYNDRNMRQKDLVLAVNEFCHLLNKTNGVIKTYTGPCMLTISQQEALVVFNTKTKQFQETNDFETAKQLFISAPENWYVMLKNPAPDNVHPEAGKAVTSPELEVGKKVNVAGPTTFSLFPGQMARVIRGHALRSNQYLLARVYEAKSASNSEGEALDAQGNKIETKETYVNGQILVIKGTEVSFYIPPTGIEVIPMNGDVKQGYVREAVTLERLEYCILKDEDGNKRYVHGPEVVFPKPTETFVASASGSLIFRAIELSPISGIYVKVIAEYKDNEGTPEEIIHPIGEELFITGEDQMIYYPRPEHAIINYDNKIMHHAIAIPEGEGRYVMDRLSGEIKTVKGPAMYLPDPRTEVVVKRKLTPSQCNLWFPGNKEALQYNLDLNEKYVEKQSKRVDLDAVTAYACSTSTSSTLANLEAKANISRGTSYSKPRTITLDNKYEGVVSMDVWTGYAVNIVSKDGSRKVICGPKTILLDYDQTLEVLNMSTGTPKNADNVIKTVFLRHENNKVSDIVDVETKDFVHAKVKVSYSVDFDVKCKDKWFNVENYVKYLCDCQRALIKREVKKYTIEEFYQNYSEIVRNVAIAAADVESTGRFFEENGMRVSDCEVLNIYVENAIADLLSQHQEDMVAKALKLSDATKRVELAKKLADAEKAEQAVRYQQLENKMILERDESLKRLEIESEINRVKEAESEAHKNAELASQGVLDMIKTAELNRKKSEAEFNLATKKAEADIEKAKQEAYAKTIVEIMKAVSPDLIAAMNSKANADMLEAVSGAMAPYAIANGESIADTVNKLLRGTSLESIIENFNGDGFKI